MVHKKIRLINEEVSKVVVGQEKLINKLLVGIFTGGHILMEGVPGLAKTLIVNTLSQIMNLDFQRIQFTPDLLPADIIGTMIYKPKLGEYEVKKGPIFANIILADEINRSPAKVQSALLEAMQEKQVTIGEETYPIERPFLVLATQNPVEQEGTYPLPEAQLDRFMMKVYVDYLTKEQELEMMRKMSNLDYDYTPKAIINLSDFKEIRKGINSITVSESLENYIVELIFASRRPTDYNLKDEARFIQFGASPRGTIQLNLVAKALAYFDGRDYVLPEDIKEAAPDVLNHRIILNYEAEAEGVSTRDVIDSILRNVAIVR